jgi:glycosyltransferase involved in cell wall biosynthesis
MNNPLVSIKTMTYNHAPYISKCIEGVLMQKTDFNFELVIGEDCSTDGTREICKEYAERYPDIIKLEISASNVGARINSLRADNACVGKYIAFCEGDDYWTDPYKLQKQVDFLEANPDYGLVHTAYSTFVQEKNKLIGPKYRKIPTGDIFNTLLKELNTISTLTILARADILNKSRNLFKDDPRKGWKMGDLPLWIGVARYSKIGYISGNTAVYRVLSESASHSSSNEKIISFYKSSFEIRRWFCDKFNLEHFLNIINENELYFLYYKTLLAGMPENAYYRNMIVKNRILNVSLWKRALKLTASNVVIRKIFKEFYSIIY